nr:uncharacterized protein LOC105321612 [Crassostrea gigas]
MDSVPPGTCEEMQQLSESVFYGLCEKLGTSQQVAIRRETKDIKELVVSRARGHDESTERVGGSRREGFRLKSSDLDCMLWLNNHRVIMDMSQFEFYNRANTTLILSDSSGSPPGFALLRRLSQTTTTDSDVLDACVKMNNRVYISSSMYRQLTCSSAFPNSLVHGPCGSGIVAGKEYDTAWCFVCDFWPSFATSWIDRGVSWPDSEVVNDIVRNGCHFVAVGHPLGPHANEEWRISFSLAEYKLVSSMNHCQFLTYGLLKLFLKEVINQQSEETSELLCSYHLKTVVFWVMQQNTLHYWCPQNFLVGFWVCFKLILKWVYEGVGPHFFIPQNNMFLSKIYGATQNILFLQLHELYSRGLACLLESPSIGSYIKDILNNPRAFICTNEDYLKSEVDYDLELFQEIIGNDHTVSHNLESCSRHLVAVEHILNSPLTSYHVLMLKKLTATILQKTAFILHMNTKSGINKDNYRQDKMSCNMLKLAAKFGMISDMLYLAMYFYKTFRYREALSVIEVTKVKLAQPYLIYRGSVDRERYTEAVGGQSWSSKMRQAVAWDITLINKICYISELIPEQESAQQSKWHTFNIPVFVMLHFLEFLCYRHVDTTLSQAALNKLHILVHNNEELYVNKGSKDISWEILGICHQITGNFQAARFSYKRSLKQIPVNKIQTATQKRLQDMVKSNTC